MASLASEAGQIKAKHPASPLRFAEKKRMDSFAPRSGAKDAKLLCGKQSMKEQISIYLFSSTPQSSRSLSIVQTLHFAILQQ
jgi:hypothetical protein